MKRQSPRSISRPASQPVELQPSASDTPALPRILGSLPHLAIAAGVYLLAILIVFADLLFAGGDQILSLAGQDTFTQFVGWFEFTFGQMAKGNLPLWNPHLYSGAPCLGGFQEALLYPPNWLHLILPLPQAINFGIVLHVFFAGLFTYLWLARRGVHLAGAILSGLIFMFSGSFFLHIEAGHLPNIQTIIWAPLIFLAIDDLVSTRSLRGAWLGGAAVAMMILAGHPQYVYYTAILAVPYAIVGVVRAPARLTAIGGFLLMGLGGVGLSAIQLFTGLQAAGESMRRQLDLDTAGSFPFPAENALTLSMPNFFGNVSGLPYWGRWFIWEDSLFIGTVGLMLALYGAIRGQPRHRRFAIVGLALAGSLIALGNATPVYQLFYSYLPGFGSFRGVSKMMFLTALFLANLAGVGLDRLLAGDKPEKTPVGILLGLMVLMVMAGTTIWVSGQSGRSGVWGQFVTHLGYATEPWLHGPMANVRTDSRSFLSFIQQSAEQSAGSLFWCAGMTAGLAALWFTARYRRRWAFAILLLASVDLLWFAWQNRPTFPRADVAKVEKDMQDRLTKLAGVDLNGHPNNGPALPDPRVLSFEPSMVLGVGANDAWGNDPMVLRRYVEFMALSLNPPSDGAPPSPARAWGIARVRLIEMPDVTTWVLLTRPYLRRAELFENVRVVPEPENLLKVLADPNFNFHETVLLEKPVSPMPAAPAGATDPPGMAEVKDVPGETDVVEVTATVNRPCVLLITDNYSTGWHARPLPDAPARDYAIVPADHTFRGILLTPGSHHFLLEYLPAAYVVGKWVSLISLGLWIIAGLMLGGWVKMSLGRRENVAPSRQEARSAKNL